MIVLCIIHWMLLVSALLKHHSVIYVLTIVLFSHQKLININFPGVEGEVMKYLELVSLTKKNQARKIFYKVRYCVALVKTFSGSKFIPFY